MPAGYLQDVLAVLDTLLVPAVEDALHAAVAHPIVQAGEEAEPEGAGHGSGAGRAPPALIEGLQREGRAVAGCSTLGVKDLILLFLAAGALLLSSWHCSTTRCFGL